MANYRTPGVYIEEISNGPRPVQASSTTETGFVAVIEIPTQFVPGGGGAAGMFLPGVTEDVYMSWNRACAFRKLTGSIDAPVAADGKDKKRQKSNSSNFWKQLPTIG
jgi:phage tail sheath protein FI